MVLWYIWYLIWYIWYLFLEQILSQREAKLCWRGEAEEARCQLGILSYKGYKGYKGA